MDYQRKRVGDVDDPRLNFEISTIVFREVIVRLDYIAIDVILDFC